MIPAIYHAIYRTFGWKGVAIVWAVAVAFTAAMLS